jgi:hypothetical protein
MNTSAADITDIFGCASGDCNNVTVGVSDVLDFGNITLTNGGGEGFHLPECEDLEIFYGKDDGQMCYQPSTDKLFIGNGAAVVENGTGDVHDVFNCGAGNCSNIGMTDGDRLVAPISSQSNDSGFIIGKDATCASNVTKGQLCLATDTDELHIGDTSNALNVGPHTYTACLTLYFQGTDLLDTDDVDSFFRAPGPLTITEVWCETDAGTVTGDLQIDGVDVMGSDLTCDTDGEADSTGLTGSMADGTRLDLEITDADTDSTDRLTFCAEYTFD